MFGTPRALMYDGLMMAPATIEMTPKAAFENTAVSRRVSICVLACCVVFTSLPFLLSAGLPYAPGHDLAYHLERIGSIARCLATGQLPAWLYPLSAYGYGYPTGICYPSAFLYPFAVLHLCGLALQDVYRVFVVCVNGATAAISYGCLRRIFRNDRIALVCTVLWMFAPYRLVDIFLRAAVGEYLALMFAPLIAYGIWRICLSDNQPVAGAGDVGAAAGRMPAWLPLALGMAGVVQSHVLSVVLFLLPGSLLLVVALRVGMRSRSLTAMLRQLGMALLVAVCLSANVIVPLFDYCLHEQLFASVIAGWAIPAERALYPLQVIGAFWPFRGQSEVIEAGPAVDMPTPVGCALSVAFIAGCALLASRRTRQGLTPVRRALLIAILVAVLLLAWASTHLFPWDLAKGEGLFARVLQAIGVIQFPWRLIGSAAFLLVLVLGIVLGSGRRGAGLLAAACVALALAEAANATLTFMSAASRVTADDLAALTNHELWSIGFGEYLNVHFDANARDTYDRLLESDADVTVVRWEHDPVTHAELDVQNVGSDSAMVVVPLLYNTRWRVVDAAADVALAEIDGYVGVRVPAGFAGVVCLSFVVPATWYAAYAVAMTSGVAVALFAVRNVRKAGTWPW